jgi:hypothetical protein
MAQMVRLWEITDEDSLTEVKQEKLNLEERIENWLENDISIISDDLLVIGRQVETSFGGIIDILCLDSNGDVVIIELKRDKTPRDITAQVLDYGSWVRDLSYEKITEIGNSYYKDENVKEVFARKFGEEYPEVINEGHKMLVVASMIDNSSERIIKYLSETYGVGINAITFNYFKKDDGKEYLSRVFIIDPEESKPTIGKRQQPLTFEQFQEMADGNGVGELYAIALSELRPLFYTVTRHITGVAIKGRFVERNSIPSIIVIYPYYSDAENGLKLSIYVDRLVEYLNLNKEELKNFLPVALKTSADEWAGLVGEYFFKDEAEINRFVTFLRDHNISS